MSPIHRDIPCRLPRALRAGAIVLAAFLVACGGTSDGGAPEEQVRNAVVAHVQGAGGEMTFEDPNRGSPVTLAFDHVHKGAHETAGGRHVVCVDFQASDGTVYDVDFYLDRAASTDAFVVEDTVVHKVAGENVLSPARQDELDRQH